MNEQDIQIGFKGLSLENVNEVKIDVSVVEDDHAELLKLQQQINEQAKALDKSDPTINQTLKNESL